MLNYSWSHFLCLIYKQISSLQLSRKDNMLHYIFLLWCMILFVVVNFCITTLFSQSNGMIGWFVSTVTLLNDWMIPTYVQCSHANCSKVTQLNADHTCFANETDTLWKKIVKNAIDWIESNRLVQEWNKWFVFWSWISKFVYFR